MENSATDRSLCLIDHRLRALAVKSFSLEKTCRNSSSNSEKVQPKSKQLEKRASAHLKAEGRGGLVVRTGGLCSRGDTRGQIRIPQIATLGPLARPLAPECSPGTAQWQPTAPYKGWVKCRGQILL
ncbi:hypothetical protein ATANTOWER_027722 [Ataeniobius toweri]|uniref:Uncharacterized protein n=1 Tax=Ataeniobius toweri TaxID=208326 RepID=A0ABU7BRW2_9TELE|nr:hypothetical protein [Ataeniobius toweri]